MPLRIATKNDLPRILEIKEAVLPYMHKNGNMQWDDTYPNESVFTKDIEEETLYIYERDDKVIAFIVVDDNHPFPYDDIPWELPMESAAAMHRFAVDPEYFGKGIARIMMDAIETMLIEDGYQGIHTDTSLENTHMQTQFTKNDFEYKGHLNLDENTDEWYVAYEKVFEQEDLDSK